LKSGFLGVFNYINTLCFWLFWGVAEVILDKSKADKIALKLLAIADGLKFGSVSVTVKFYGGQIVTVSYAKTE